MGNRTQRAKYNVFFSLALQIVSIVCGLIVPRLIIRAFGSEIYGATTSISQFLSYIALLEGGIGGVARASLYKPLADKDAQGISSVVNEIKRFFFYIGCAFLAYVVILSISFRTISHTEVLDVFSSIALVWAISFSTFLQYFVGLSYGILLQADQKEYICAIFSIFTIATNAVLVYILIVLKCSIITVKFVSSAVFAMKPILQYLYVKKNYNIIKTERNKEALKQKWTGLGQHFAYFIHSNTDIVVLTVFSNLKAVAVYSVYNMVISSIQNLTKAFSSGMEALFGELYSKKETEQLKRTFSYYDVLISAVSVLMFSVTCVLIIPFVKLYTNGITDANYIVPEFSLLLLLAAVIFCLRIPYHSLTIAAGMFKETKMAAYGEALINLTLSIILVIRYNLIGVAIGTVVATVFRFIYYAVFLSRHIIHQKVYAFFKRISVDIIMFLCVVMPCNFIVSQISLDNYLKWTIAGIAVFTFGLAVVLLINGLFYRCEMKAILTRLKNRVARKTT